MSVRTRFAPSPTGELHLGNARTAILNWLFARRHQGAFIVRFEDTDIERQVAASEASIREALDWLCLDRDEDPWVDGPYGPYRQSEREALYRSRAEWLVERGLAFRCWCTPEELEARRESARAAGGPVRYDGRCRELSPEQEARFREQGRAPAVRFRVEPGPIRFRDRTAGEVTIDGSDFGDLVILRSDGRPTYNHAAVVDDIEMEITHVIRGAGHLSNTPKQVLLYRAFDAPLPDFVHVPTVLAPGGERLSKRAGAPSVLRYRDEGYHPHAVVNYLSLLSWSAEGGEEVLSPSDLIERIDLDRLGGAEPILALDKMRWLSGQHIRRESPDVLARRLEPFVDRSRWDLTERDLEALAEVERERIHLFADAVAEAERLFDPPDLGSPDAARALESPRATAALSAAESGWGGVRAWTPEKLRGALSDAAERSGLKGGQLYRPIRVALTGTLRGPELPDVAYALGRDRCLDRLRAARLRAAGRPDGLDGAEAPDGVDTVDGSDAPDG